MGSWLFFSTATPQPSILTAFRYPQCSPHPPPPYLNQFSSDKTCLHKKAPRHLVTKCRFDRAELLFPACQGKPKKETTAHYGPVQQITQMKVLGHSLVQLFLKLNRLLLQSHRSLIFFFSFFLHCSLTRALRFAHLFAC